MSSAANPLAEAKTAETQTTEVSLLDQIVAQGRFGKDTVAQERGKDMVKEFVNQVLEGKMTLSRDAEASIGMRIAEIDRLVSLQLNEVLHHPAFQRLEATWRGIKHLLDQSETSDMLKIKLLNVSKRDLLRDLQRAPEFDQSAFFKKVYEEEFGVFGGAPFAALVGDYEFGRSGEDVELLERVSQVASAAHAPFLSAAAPEMMNLTEYGQLTGIRDMSKVFDSTEYAKWKSFRASDDSRYVALTLPHILMREPYGKETRQIEEFAYEEGVDGRDNKKYLWGNAAYGLAARLTQSFAKFGWCASI
ncbi:MAG: type VI secretion system contractile sheath large subunit, partial [Terracidiphilus sp.]